MFNRRAFLRDLTGDLMFDPFSQAVMLFEISNGLWLRDRLLCVSNGRIKLSK